ncbi:MAG: EamA family transporter RarD [Anaerolineae bacterium]
MMNKGIAYALVAYGTWGFLPIFWKALHNVPAVEILSHRMVWSLIFLVLVLSYKQHWQWLRAAVHHPATLATFVGTALLLTINWLTYIWAVNAGFIVETSLGYFINPLVNVALGFIFLGERLRRGQWLAIVIALLGVLYLTLSYGALPWIALTLAFSFATYGLLRKTARLNALEGLSFEMGVVTPIALAYLIYLQLTGTAAFGQSGSTTLLLILTGGITAVPLLAFSAAARRVTLTTLGILQYIAPTLQFLIGVFIYGEVFGTDQMIGFGLIWGALLLYAAESVAHNGKQHRLARQQLP